MRLKKVENGQRLPYRLFLGFLTLLEGDRMPDVLRMLLYRPQLFGRPAGRWLQSVIRAKSEWSVGERELFAAFTSQVNRCPY